ncbi:hypothetical protein [Rhodanobacter sp. DHB23]|uniref:hypothetical protein n=1 Tax=Rhodanobacter sp. DHB23 TaxID=2775923 RepID=UPI001785729F|nr:hypothetical protein [Rhodanobacter sp. DHB23]MBD8873856.1 hypothetical protein [Rhodanobacter sp. DHB23]
MQILEMFGIAGSAGAVIGAVLLFGLPRYAGSYLSEKGKGLATKEDIGKITTIVESIKHDNEVKLAQVTEALRAQTSLRLLAGERRLETHQKAYLLWLEMLDHIHMDEGTARAELKDKFRDFYVENCLYLDAAVRVAFIDALTSYDIHLDLLRGQYGTPEYNREQMVIEITNNMQRVKNLGRVIETACDLPSFSREGEKPRARS